MKINKLLALSLISLSTMAIQAQNKQEIGVTLGGGLSSLDYKNVSTSIVDRGGFTLGGSYTYYLNDNWGLKTGLELFSYHSKTDINSIKGAVDAIDDEKEVFEYRYEVGGYTETQNMYVVNIPLMAQFETNRANSITNFYATAGVKIGIPVSSKYKSNMSSIETRGHYPSTNATYDDLYFVAFGTFSDHTVKGNIDTNIQIAGSLEVGLKNKIGEKLFIYSGLYCDYGLNNVTSKKKTFLEYDTNAPHAMKNNSVLNNSTFVQSVKPISLGIKINLAFEL